MKIVFFQDPDKHKREIGQRYLADFRQWHQYGYIGETYQHLAKKAEDEIRRWKNVVSTSEADDVAHDAALEAWKHLANRHHTCPVHLYNEIALCLRQKIIRRTMRMTSIKTFGTREELSALGFKDEDDGGIGRTIFRLDLSQKLKHDLADFRSSLATDCLTKQLLTVREIQEYAGFSNYQARELKEIMMNFVEEYCAIS